MAGAPWGVLLYLRQEGRGIGLVNKLRAYALQDQGYDTVDANLRLGFPVEARDFAIAGRMLDLLAIPRILLMTNNPEKVERLEAEGVEVIERSEEHTSELQSLMRISYAVFCLKKKNKKQQVIQNNTKHK